MTDTATEEFERALQASRDKRWHDAQCALTIAIELLRPVGPGERLGLALRELGEVERRLGNREQASVLYEESVAILRKCHTPLPLAHTVRHLGDVYRELGRAHMARPCYEEAMALYRQHPEAAPLDVANATRSMALLQQEADEWDESRQLWDEALKIYTALGIDAGVAECETRLCQLNSLTGAEPQAQ
jgi:tetratricopeptide (TPR) repeat protein